MSHVLVMRTSTAVMSFLAVVGLLIVVHERPIVASQAGSSRASEMETDDDRFARVEQRAPGFGGMFLDADGRLVVYLIDVAHLPAARLAIERVFGSGFAPSAGVRAVKGQYTISQLNSEPDAFLVRHPVRGCQHSRGRADQTRQEDALGF